MSEEINLLDYVRVMSKWRNFIISFTAAAVVLTVVICLIVPWKYKAETTILIPQQSGKGIEGLLELSSMMTGSTMNIPTDITQSMLGRSTNFSDILKSKTVSGMIVDGLNLGTYWHMKSHEALIKRVRKEIKVKEQKGMLKISVIDRNPRLAADIANYAAMALDEYNKRGNVQFARRMSNFIQEQLANSKVDLSDAEEKLKKFETQSQMVQISEKELMLERLMRDVKVKEAIYTMLLQEYEKSKIEEAKEELFFEVLDPAAPTYFPYAPQPFLYSVIALVLGFFISVFAAFFFEYLEETGVKVPQMDYNSEVEWRKISRYLTTRKR